MNIPRGSRDHLEPEADLFWSGLPAGAEVILVFDGRCGFCTACVDLLRRCRYADRVAFVPCQSRRAEALPPGPDQGCIHAAWTVRRDGECRSGSAAVLEALAVATGKGWLGRIPGWPAMGWTGEAVYRLVAHNRGHLPGAVPYCERHPEECEREGL